MTTTEVIKVLAIDDRPDNLTALCAAVRQALPQTAVLTAADGPAGIALAAAEDPDVILLGAAKPGLDGFEICRRLKADERLNEIPVVFVTERTTDAASRVKALEAGAEGFLAQPLDLAELIAELRAMVKVKTANRRQQLEKGQLEAMVAERTQALHEGDEVFRVAQEMSPDGFTILHPVRGTNGEIVDFTWVYENQAIARINGTDPEEVKGKRLLDLFPTHEGTALWEAYTRVADTGQPQTIEEVYVGEIVSRPTWLRLIVVSIDEDIAILAEDITDRKQAEEERKKSEDRLKAAERMAHLGSWELDLVTNVLTWSDEIYRIFEIDPAQFGATLEAFNNAIHPDDRDAVSQAYSSSLETRTDYEIDHRLLMPDGRVKYVHEHCITLYDANGRALRSVGTVHDITERKLAEEALCESEARYRFMAENIGDVLWVMDVATQRFTYVSPSVMKLRGYTPEEVMAQPVAETLTPDSRQLVQELITTRLLQFKAHPQIQQFTTDPQNPVSYVNEADQPCKDGSIVHTEVTTTWSRTPEGQLQIIGVSRDITERKRAEAALRKSEEEYRSMLNSVQVGVVVHAPDTSILFSNPRASQLLGLTPDQMRGKTAIDKAWRFIREDETPMPLEEYPVNRVLVTNQPLTDLTLGILRPDREGPTWVQCNAHQDWDSDGNLQRVVVSFADITDHKQAEEELRKNHNMLDNILNAIPQSVFWKDRESRYLGCNAQFARAVGLQNSHEIVGKTDFDLPWPAEEANVYREDDSDVMARNSPKTHIVEPLQQADGSRLWIDTTKIPLLDSDGNVYGVLGVYEDVTERKRAEESLQQASDILNNMQMGLYVYELENPADDRTLRMVAANPASGTLSGVPTAELIGKYIDEIFPGLRILDIPRRFADVVRTGRAGESEDVYYADDRMLQAAYAVKAFPLPKHRVGVTFDNITARKQMEEERARLSAEVRAQARQMAQVLATVPAGVLLLDAAGQVLQANTVAAGDLAALAGVAVGDTLTRLGNRPLAELLAAPPTRGVWHEVKAAGRIFEVIARPVENDPEPKLWVLVINDVTREREIQAQLQQQAQLAVVGQLAAGIAHDFNNIMAVIVLYAEMGMSMADVPPQLRERLGVILQQANRATDLVQQILDFSRRAVLERRPLDLVRFLKETVKLLERTLPESIRIELLYAQDEYTVSADPTRMQQAIMNLATNARDAMLPQGGGELRITLSHMAATDETRCIACGQVFVGDQYVRIAVTDSGSGIAPEALSHIFEPFFTTKEVGKGTGLGLAQVYGIVKQHEGHLDVVTEVGRGTTFNLYLPALLVQSPEAPAYEKQATIQGQGETVLLVEDNAILRDALADILEALNYRTLQAASGSEALAVLAQRADEIALVLTDLVMPEMGGQALLHAMRQRSLTLPVVILSGHPMESELEELQAQGLAGWMLKPPSVKPLAQLLARVLHRETEPG